MLWQRLSRTTYGQTEVCVRYQIAFLGLGDASRPRGSLLKSFHLILLGRISIGPNFLWSDIQEPVLQEIVSGN